MFVGKFSKTAVTMLAATLVSALVVGGCSDDDDNGGGGGGGSTTLGATLTINAPVYWFDSHWSGNSWREVYTPFDGSRALTTGFWHEYRDEDGYWRDEFISIGGSGGIVNGQINFSISTPSTLVDITESLGGMEDYYDNFNISNSNANVARLRLRIPCGNSNNCYDYRGGLDRGREVMTRRTETESAGFWEEVDYIYVDRDVTISGRGKTNSESGSSWTRIRTTRNFTLNLKTGWNAVHVRSEWSETYINDHETYTSTQTISLGDPSHLRWIIWEDYDWDTPPSIPPRQHTPLTEDVWRDATFTSRVEHWYSFAVTEGTTYYLWDNDMYGDGTKTADIMADVWYADGTRARHTFDDYFDYPASFTASQSGTVFVRTYPEYRLGTYAIVYSTSNVRPGSSMSRTTSFNRTVDDGDVKKKTERAGMFRDRDRRNGAR